jgi:molybdopterin synthase catalytic subunit
MKEKTTVIKKKKNVFVDGPISPTFIADSIAKHQSKTDIGAHNIFLGQVRKDRVENKNVVAIEYSSYREMAASIFDEIREEAFSKFDLTCLHIYHSTGVVKAGEICLFVFVSSSHREQSFLASKYIVEEIKLRVPLFGKEIFEDSTHQWKVNK